VTKTCAKCEIEQSLEEYPRDKRASDGRASQCKRCEAARAKRKGFENAARIVIDLPEAKFCPQCKINKPSGGFDKSKRNPDGLAGWCKTCSYKQRVARRTKNSLRVGVVSPLDKICPSCKVKKGVDNFSRDIASLDGLQRCCKVCSRYSQIKCLYGVEKEYYDKALRKYGGCEICFFPPPLGEHLHVDHDHKTDEARGLLCLNCNFGLGHSFDCSVTLTNLAAYVDRAFRAPLDILGRPPLPYEKRFSGPNFTRTLGVSVSTRDRLLATQGGSCYGCGLKFCDYLKPVLDHNHRDGMVRGYLCSHCNSCIGYFADSPGLILKVVYYLNKYKESQCAL
jgi:hypothetical protein